MYSDMKFCVDCKSEGAIKHMSSQGMLEQLVNSIIEGPLNKPCKTMCSRSYFFQISKFHIYKCNKRKNKDLNKGGLELLVTWIPSTRGCAKCWKFMFFKNSSWPMYSDMKFCVDYKSEGANKHMSSQGMLKQLVNSIIEGCIHNSWRTVCGGSYFIFR